MKKIKSSVIMFKDTGGKPIKEILTTKFNDLIKEKLQKEPMPYGELIGYLNAFGDIYSLLCGDKNKIEFDKKILNILEKLRTGKILAVKEE